MSLRTCRLRLCEGSSGLQGIATVACQRSAPDESARRGDQPAWSWSHSSSGERPTTVKPTLPRTWDASPRPSISRTETARLVGPAIARMRGRGHTYSRRGESTPRRAEPRPPRRCGCHQSIFCDAIGLACSSIAGKLGLASVGVLVSGQVSFSPAQPRGRAAPDRPSFSCSIGRRMVMVDAMPRIRGPLRRDTRSMVCSVCLSRRQIAPFGSLCRSWPRQPDARSRRPASTPVAGSRPESQLA